MRFKGTTTTVSALLLIAGVAVIALGNRAEPSSASSVAPVERTSTATNALKGSQEELGHSHGSVSPIPDKAKPSVSNKPSTPPIEAAGDAKVAGAEVFAEPKTPEDVKALLDRENFKHFGTTVIRAIDNVFRDEHRDDNWAAGAETAILEGATEVPGAVLSGECRQSLCRYGVTFLVNRDERTQTYRQLVDHVSKYWPLEVPGPFESDILYDEDPRKATLYFLSTNPPAAWAYPFWSILSKQKSELGR